MDKDKLIEVTDKDLIVYLVANGYEIKHIIRDYMRPARSKVYFDKTNSLSESITRFTNKNTSINFSDFIAAERRVNTLLQTLKAN